VAKVLDLPYPGGPEVEALAAHGVGDRFELPRPMLRKNQRPEDADYYDVSFSGLKTAVANLVAELDTMGVLDERRADVAASFQEAAVEVLVAKTLRAVKETGCHRVLLGGGVSANGRLREVMSSSLGRRGKLLLASPRLSLDNGAMVARAGRFRLDRGEVAEPEMEASASLAFPGLVRRAGAVVAG
jgi:N6-L-threonylcarbamoyladenine synthase